MGTKFTMKPVSGLPPRKPRKPNENGPAKVYHPLFLQIIEADSLGFFADADNYLEVAAYGGAGTASSTKKAILTGKTETPDAPEGKKFTIIARRVERIDTDGEAGAEVETEIKSVLLVRIDAIDAEVTVEDDAVEPEEAEAADAEWEAGYAGEPEDAEV